MEEQGIFSITFSDNNTFKRIREASKRSEFMKERIKSLILDVYNDEVNQDILMMYEKQRDVYLLENEIDITKEIPYWEELKEEEKEILIFVFIFFAFADNLVTSNIDYNLRKDTAYIKN